MSDRTVVTFPRAGLVPDDVATAPKQLSLFGYSEEKANYISFVDISEIVQPELFHLIAANAVSSILDLRAAPVFRRPSFDHVEVMEYLAERCIPYFEYAVATVEESGSRRFDIARSVNRGRAYGLTLCIYDYTSREKGWLDKARSILGRSNLFAAELSPRALTGYI